MRKVLAVLVVILAFSSVSEARERFVVFPGLGTCTGTYVRYRADTDTEAEIIGRLNTPDRVIVLGQTAIDGQIWYEIEDPRNDGTAFVFGKYIVPVYEESSQRTEAAKMIVNILQNYGITREKSDLYDGPEARRRYSEDNYLYEVDARKKGCSFGDISIGDDAESLEELLGEPESQTDTKWEYRVEDTILTFWVEDGRITRMRYED